MAIVNTRNLFFIALVLSFNGFVLPYCSDDGDVEAIDASISFNKFSYAFYKATDATLPGSNLVMSPLSANIILALLSLGAEGDTLNELNQGLYIPDEDYTRAVYQPAISNLISQTSVELNLANKVYVGDQFELNPSFQTDAQDIFYSEIENIDFSQGDAATKTINTWVEDKTKNLIKDLIPPGALDSGSRMVLVNTIYFKGEWLNKFKEFNTNKQDFFRNKNDKIQVDMMSQSAEFSYGTIPSLKAKAVEMFYKGEEFSFVIILPNSITGLKSIEKKIKPSTDLKSLLKGLTKNRIRLSIPKFKIETSMDLNVILPKVGINRIFSPTDAELGRLLNNNEKLSVTKAVQKAFIEVNEAGTVAAAATGIVVGVTSVPTEPKIKFIADRPFLYILKAKDGTILFLGKYIG